MTIPIPGLDQLSDETIFNFCSQIIVPAWLVLLVAPRWKMRKTIVYATILINCAIYTATFAASMASSEDSLSKTFADMGTLDGVIQLFTHDDVIVPAWVHYLAFDLTVGNYLVETNMADPAGLPQLLMVPVLFFTLMAGPTGVMAYTAMRTFTGLFGSSHALKTS